MTLRTEVQLVSKTVNPLFSNHPVLSLPSANLPTFLSWDALMFNIQGSNFTEAWNTYEIQVNALIDETPGAPVGVTYKLFVTTEVDCLTGLKFALPYLFKSQVIQTIGSGVKQVEYWSATDSISTEAKIN